MAKLVKTSMEREAIVSFEEESKVDNSDTELNIDLFVPLRNNVDRKVRIVMMDWITVCGMSSSSSELLLDDDELGNRKREG